MKIVASVAPNASRPPPIEENAIEPEMVSRLPTEKLRLLAEKLCSSASTWIGNARPPIWTSSFTLTLVN